MATDISFFLYGNLLHELPIFRGLGKEVMSQLCKSVSAVHLSRGNIVCQENKFGEDMYFVINGEVEVLIGGERLGFLGEGAFFGTTTAAAAVATSALTALDNARLACGESRC